MLHKYFTLDQFKNIEEVLDEIEKLAKESEMITKEVREANLTHDMGKLVVLMVRHLEIVDKTIELSNIFDEMFAIDKIKKLTEQSVF